MAKGEYYFRTSIVENSTGYLLFFVKKHWADGSESVESPYFKTPQEADAEAERLNEKMIDDEKKSKE